MPNKSKAYRVGHVAIVGKANVGKSTLLNHLIGQKISITTRKPQTTRHHISGISTSKLAQIIYIDTPGIQKSPKSAMNRYMNRQAYNVLDFADVILFVVEALHWEQQDEGVLTLLKNIDSTVLIVVNKIDKIDDKKKLLPFIEQLTIKSNAMPVFPISALQVQDAENLQNTIVEYLPEGEPVYDESQITDRSVRFMAAEIVREKLTRRLGDELPYQLTVTIESFKEKKSLIQIGAIIWVERKGQKAIVIGKNGALIKSIGEQSRMDLENLLQNKVYLDLWVKQKDKWTDDEKALLQFNYDQ